MRSEGRWSRMDAQMDTGADGGAGSSRCAVCGWTGANEYRFCPSCGAPLNAPDPAGVAGDPGGRELQGSPTASPVIDPSPAVASPALPNDLGVRVGVLVAAGAMLLACILVVTAALAAGAPVSPSDLPAAPAFSTPGTPLPPGTFDPSPAPTRTPKATATPKPTHTPKPADPARPIATPKPTALPTATYAPTATPVPTATSAPTPAPTATFTPAPVPTGTGTPCITFCGGG